MGGTVDAAAAHVPALWRVPACGRLVRVGLREGSRSSDASGPGDGQQESGAARCGILQHPAKISRKIVQWRATAAEGTIRSPWRAMMLQPATRSNPMVCDRALRFMGGCLPCFAGLSGYPSIAVLSRLAGLGGTSVLAVETLPPMLNCAVIVAAAYQCAGSVTGHVDGRLTRWQNRGAPI
jgi:hypothetical protein